MPCIATFSRALLLPSLMAVLPALAPGTEVTPNLAQLSNSILAVNADNCGDGKQRHATGFVYRDRSSAVTAMHVVGGCRTITVYYQNAKVSKAARLARVDRNADLALLTIDSPPDVPPLTLESREPALSDPLQVLGFPLQIPKMSSTSLHLRFGGQTLREIVPSAVARTLAEGGSPSLDLNITNIEGHLVHGLSGAPIFNNSNRVVAVGDGGLDDGAVGISWGIPASALAHLLQSNDTTPNAQAHASNLFSSESESADLGTVTCSGLALTKLRKVSFPQIAASTDDMQGLGFIAGYFNIDPSPYQFDVYQDLTSGATIVLPTGATLLPDSRGCIARIDNGNVLFRVEAGHQNSLPELQKQSQQFEIDAVGGNPMNWFPDPTFTYPMPHPRFDNFLVRRRAWTHNVMGINGQYQDGYMFETIAARNGLSLTTSALDTGLSPQKAQRWNLCRSNPGMQGCDDVRASARAWVGAVLSVHLTTFPIG